MEEEEEEVLRFGQNSKTTGRPNSGPRDPSLPLSLWRRPGEGGREGNNRTGSERERGQSMDETKDLHSTNSQEQKFRKIKLGALKLV